MKSNSIIFLLILMNRFFCRLFHFYFNTYFSARLVDTLKIHFNLAAEEKCKNIGNISKLPMDKTYIFFD